MQYAVIKVSSCASHISCRDRLLFRCLYSSGISVVGAACHLSRLTSEIFTDNFLKVLLTIRNCHRYLLSTLMSQPMSLKSGQSWVNYSDLGLYSQRLLFLELVLFLEIFLELSFFLEKF